SSAGEAAPHGAQATAQGVCVGWQPASRWRCILRGLAYDALEQTKLPLADQARLGEALLSAAQPKRLDADQQHR
ncbi:MAG: hypothetical protein ABUL60_24185, partial [Myxococcales bacterium]